MPARPRWIATRLVLTQLQGDGCAVDDYLSRLRGLRWQAMAVRGEEDVPVASTQVRAIAPGAWPPLLAPAPGRWPHQNGGCAPHPSRCWLPQELEAARRLGRGVQELGEEDMGRLSAAAKEAGLEELFLTALKLAPR